MLPCSTTDMSTRKSCSLRRRSKRSVFSMAKSLISGSIYRGRRIALVRYSGSQYLRTATLGFPMKLSRRTLLQLAVGAIVLPAVRGSAHALDYPTRPVRIFVGFPPGLSPDIIARLVGQ